MSRSERLMRRWPSARRLALGALALLLGVQLIRVWRWRTSEAPQL